jgi:ATP-binding cassette subfamily C protein
MTPILSTEQTVPRLLLNTLRRHPQALLRLAAWSVLEVTPLLLSGYGVAQALDAGFIAGRPEIGLAWLGVLGVAALAGACSTRSFVVSAISAVIGIAALTGVVALLVLPPLLAGLGFFLVSLRAMMSRQREHVLTDEGVAESASTIANSLRDVVACGGEDQACARVQRDVDAHAAAERTVARMTAIRTLSVAIGGWLPALGLLFGAHWLMTNGLTLGAIAGGLIYLTQGLLPALKALVDGLGAGGVRLVVTLDRLLEAGERPVPARPARQQTPHGHDFVVDGVTFCYGRHAEPVVKALDLVIPEGQHLAMIGPSGAGKSTLAGLLAATHVPAQGQIRLGGVPVADFDPSTLASHRVLIPQEAYVFAGTLGDNLRYLHPSATRAELDAVVAELDLRAMVSRLGGYDAVIDPGTLSAGERQLIAVARAHLTPAPVLILDEATCHLDPATEERVERVLAGRRGTLIVVAHRISSALRAQRIVLMDGADLVTGTHRELIATAPLYRDLVLGHAQQ